MSYHKYHINIGEKTKDERDVILPDVTQLVNGMARIQIQCDSKARIGKVIGMGQTEHTSGLVGHAVFCDSCSILPYEVFKNILFTKIGGGNPWPQATAC